MLIVLQFVRDIAVLEIPYPCTFYFSLLLSFSSTLNSFLFEPFFLLCPQAPFRFVDPADQAYKPSLLSPVDVCALVCDGQIPRALNG